MDHKAALTMIPGVEDVTRWFGEWPSFHDAEVVSLLLMLKGESVLRFVSLLPRQTRYGGVHRRRGNRC